MKFNARSLFSRRERVGASGSDDLAEPPVLDTASASAPAVEPPTALQLSLAPLVGLLPKRKARTVVMLAARADRDCLRLVEAEFTNDRVFIVSTQAPPSSIGSAIWMQITDATLPQVEDGLVKIGPIDILLQHSPLLLDDQVRAVRRLLFHLRRGGVYLVDGQACASAPGWSDFLGVLGRTAQQSLTRTDQLPPAELELARSVRTVVFAQRLILVSKETTHHLKLREAETDQLLTSRRGVRAPRIIAERAPGSWRSRATLRHYGVSAAPAGFDPDLRYPAVSLREYRGKVGLISNSLIYGDHVIFAGSFRHHLAPNLMHQRASFANERFGHIPARYRPRDELSGSYFHADSAYSGHFGHVMTEVASRFWAWPEAKAACPELKAIYRLSGRPERALVERQMLEGLGIASDDIVAVEMPVALDGIYSATAMWHNSHPHYVHPEMANVWEELRRNLIRPQTVERPTRIFVSRPPKVGGRQCRNADDVERYFAAHGFAVVHPERHSLTEQASIFAAAEVVAGFAGSALLNLMFSKHLKSLVVLGHLGYTARNEYLMASLLGCEMHYFWTEPDIPHPPRRWSRDAFASPWAFDFNTQGADLDAIVA